MFINKKYMPLIHKVVLLLAIFTVFVACNRKQNPAPTHPAEDESSLTILIPRTMPKSLDLESRIRPALEALEELLGFHDESDSANGEAGHNRRQELGSVTRLLYTQGGNALLDCGPALYEWIADQVERYR